MKGILLGLTLLAGAAPLGCSTNCDLSAHSGLTLTIVDAQSDAPILDATVTYSIDGEDQDPVEGTLFSTGVYGLGIEHPGSYEVHIEAPGHAPADRSYEITDGECHVHGQQDTVALEPT